jgi:hypothetical protein
MKKLITTARNITHSIHDNKIFTEIEAVLGVEEPLVQVINGRVVSFPTSSMIRFGLNIAAADALLGDLARWTEEAKQQAARLELKEADE